MRRHDLDMLSFLFGLLFTAVGLLVMGGDPVHGSVSLAWAGPAAAITIALVIVLAVRPRRAARRADAPDEETTTEGT